MRSFLQNFIKRDWRRPSPANPLANEVSRAFIPPCTRGDFSPQAAALGPAPYRGDRNPSRQLKPRNARGVPSYRQLELI